MVAVSLLPGVAMGIPKCAIEIEANRVAALEESFFLIQFRAQFAKWQVVADQPKLQRLARNSGISRYLLNQWLYYANQLGSNSVRKYAPTLAAELRVSEEQFLNAAGLTSVDPRPPVLEKYPAIYKDSNRSQVALKTGIDRVRFYNWENETARPQRWEIRALALWEADRLGLKGRDAVEEWITRRYFDYGFLTRPYSDSESQPRWIPTWALSPKLGTLRDFVQAPANCFLEQVVRAWQKNAPAKYLYDPAQAAISLSAIGIDDYSPEGISPQFARELALKHNVPWKEMSELLGMASDLPKLPNWLTWWSNGRDLQALAKQARVPQRKLMLENRPARSGQLSRKEITNFASAIGASRSEALMAAGFFPSAEDKMQMTRN